VTDNVESRSLGIHGTNDPTSIGKRVSQGCIRMRNEDVEALFEILPEGATVTVQP
jgi:lipoprotein-anchoring transpeptidase ErfK/SrfK